MSTALPITFSHQQQRNNGDGQISSSIDNPSMISPSMATPWRGSPMSYSILARSFGKNSFTFSSLMGTSPAGASIPQLSASFTEMSDFRVNGIPSSLDSEAGKILKALHGDDAQNKDLIQNYSCCGLDLPDLHALLEHFEEVHVVVPDSPSLRPSVGPDASTPTTSSLDESPAAFDPDSMDLDSGPSSSASTPPSTPPHDSTSNSSHHASLSSAFDNLRTSRGLNKPMSGYNTPRGVSPHPSIPGIDTSAGMLTSGRNEAALFNPYASYADFSALMPGTVRTPIHQSPPQVLPNNGNTTNANGASNAGGVGVNGTHSTNGSPHAAPGTTQCIPPALLFSPSAQTTPMGTPIHSRTGTPVPGGSSSAGNLSRTGSLSGSTTASPAALMSAGTEPSSGKISSALGIKKSHSLNGVAGNGTLNPQLVSSGGASSSSSGSSGLVSKPFRCPTIGCNKSYKQANGLKYHITHGQCNFMPRDPALEGLNESEADEKARPYVCQVGSCTRRYKNMNGLRYHYQHTGQHGAVGLALLASGQHSLQTGLKDAGVEIPPQVKEQHLLAAQAMQRSLNSGPSTPSTPTTPTGSGASSAASTAPSTPTSTMSSMISTSTIVPNVQALTEQARIHREQQAAAAAAAQAHHHSSHSHRGGYSDHMTMGAMRYIPAAPRAPGVGGVGIGGGMAYAGYRPPVYHPSPVHPQVQVQTQAHPLQMQREPENFSMQL